MARLPRASTTRATTRTAATRLTRRLRSTSNTTTLTSNTRPSHSMATSTDSSTGTVASSKATVRHSKASTASLVLPAALQTATVVWDQPSSAALAAHSSETSLVAERWVPSADWLPAQSARTC
jgi:hypothetical protein